MKPGRTIIFLLAACAYLCLGKPRFADASHNYTEAPLGSAVVAKGLTHPWAIAFLPDGRMLVTERPGRLRLLDQDGRLSPPVAGVPMVHAEGQGGLLDVAVDPDFSRNGFIYLSYAEPLTGGEARTAVARGQLSGNALQNVSVIFRQTPSKPGGAHFGSRLVFDREGNLFITLGDRFNYREEAQNLKSQLGKIVRIRPDGSIPADNPFPSSPIFSLGHRNVQGAALHPVTGDLWVSEHGPQGGDEVNIVRSGKNYGWPVATYGVEYGTARKIGEGETKAGMEDAIKVWVPSIAPSGMAFSTSDSLPAWKGSLFVAALKFELLVRLTLEGNRVTGEERLLPEPRRRLRDVAEGPDGSLYVVTDEEEGEVWKVFPK